MASPSPISPPRPAAARVPARRSRRRKTRACAADQDAARIQPDVRLARLPPGLHCPEIYEMQVRAIVRAASGRRPDAPATRQLRDHAAPRQPRKELRRCASSDQGRRNGGRSARARVPLRDDDRAAARCAPRRRVAEVADFFSFGTNDLTQTALGMSRDDAEGKFLTFYVEDGVLERNPFEVLDQAGVGDLMRIADRAGERDEARDQARHLRRARRRAELGRVLPPDRARLRELLAVPRPARPPRRRAGRAEGGAPGENRPSRSLVVSRYELLVDGEREQRVSSVDELACG